MKNYKKAYKLYEKGGCSAVVDACNNGKLKYDKWGECEPCESEQPIYDDACLVCGTTYIKKNGSEKLRCYEYMGVMYYKHTSGYYYIPDVSMKFKTHKLIRDWIETDIKGEF